jgi:outer membrane protein assembly factor BamB
MAKRVFLSALLIAMIVVGGLGLIENVRVTNVIQASATGVKKIAGSNIDDWSMFHHDPAHTGYTTTEALIVTPDAIWSKPGGYEGVFASPSVVDDVVYITSADLYAFNASTGEEIWSVSGGGWGTNPIVNGYFVYCGGIAYDASTGSELWSPNPPGARVTQAFADGYLYAYAYNTSFPQVGAGVVALLCLNATTGAEIWRMPVDFISTDPAVANGTLYIAGSKGTFYALDAYTGNEIWNCPLEASPSSSGSSPAVYGGIVYIGSFWDGNVYALNTTNGQKIWNFTTSAFVESSPAVANGVVYIGSDDGNFYALNASDGAKNWNYTTSGGESSPTVAGGVVYVGGFNGKIYALNASNGDKLWNYTVQKPPGVEEYSGLHTSPSVVNGRVYIGSNDYILLVLGEGSSNSTPSPSTTPTPEQTPTPTPNQEPQQTEPLEIIIGLVIVVAVFVAGLGLLIYLIKRR